jgi:hypothetical protein
MRATKTDHSAPGVLDGPSRTNLSWARLRTGWRTGWRTSPVPPNWLFPFLLLVFSIGYYSAYALSGLDLQGEGGTIGVIAMRLNAGARPIADTFLGYNLFWFAPVAGLFSVFGPSYLAIKIFFFALCTVTGQLGYRILLRATGRPLLSFTGALLIILVPGMQFRNYMGFLAVGNLFFLLEAFVFEQPSLTHRFCWLGASAFCVAFTYLFRIDLGTFFSVLLVGTAAVHLLLGPGRFRTRLWCGAAAGPMLLLAFFLVHYPVDQYARAKHFETEFWAQYNQWWADIGYRSLTLLDRVKSRSAQSSSPSSLPPSPKAATSVSPSGANPDTVQTAPNNDRSTRPLPSVESIFLAPRAKQRELAFLLYAPLVSSLVILLVAIGLAFWGIRRNDARSKTISFVLLVALGSALTLFPQYFFFRPDPPHLSEMMCLFVLVSIIALGLALDLSKTRRQRWQRWAGIVWISFLCLHLWIYARYGVNQPWMGAIAIKKKGETKAEFANQVIAYLPRATKAEYQQLFHAIESNSGPDDYVVSFPYSPMIDFMTNRRSYLYNLYVDNSTRAENFDAQAIADIEKYRPRIIAIDNVAMNASEPSRFSAWAAKTLAYVQSHYRYLGRFVGTDLYARD